VLAGVLGNREAGCVHCVEAIQQRKAVYYCIWFSARNVLKTICSNIRPCAPEDGHNGARNMLCQWLINKSQLLHQVGLTNHFTYTVVHW